jgi:hypothetical protein
MDHNEIRFRILHTLYQKHYSPQLQHPQNTDKVIEEDGLANTDKYEVMGDIVYLEEKHLIKGNSFLGDKYPPWVKITSYGIDFVERVFERFVQNLEKENIDNESKSKVRQLLNENNSMSSKIQTVVDLAQKYTGLWLNIIQIVGSLFGNR